MTDPMTRIAEALELLALGAQLTCREATMLRERIKARHSGAQTPPPDDDPARKPATVASEPQTADVLGSELRVGDVTLGWIVDDDDDEWGRFLQWRSGPATVARLDESGTSWEDDGSCLVRPNTIVRVRLPRPAVEPIAKAKCPTCRCMIVPGAACACCVSTSGDDPPLPDLDLDDAEPSAGGEEIARAVHLCVTVSYGSGSYTWTAHNEGEANTIAAAVNAAHANATRELRERLATAERERNEARAAFNGVADDRDRAKLERDAAVKRAELAERVVKVADHAASALRGFATRQHDERGDIAAQEFADAWATQLETAVEAARKDGGK